MGKKPTEPRTAESTEKKKYTSPRLAEYGDLREIVQMNKASNRNDGSGTPATKR